jgi:predicted nucleic acid-binding protein
VYRHDRGRYRNGFRIKDESGISFWDALICASALKAGAYRILSEDFNAGQSIAGVRIEIPSLEPRHEQSF